MHNSGAQPCGQIAHVLCSCTGDGCMLQPMTHFPGLHRVTTTHMQCFLLIPAPGPPQQGEWWESGAVIRILHTCSWHSSLSWIFLILAQGCGMDDPFPDSNWLQVYIFLRSVLSSHVHVTVLRLDVSPAHGGRNTGSPLGKGEGCSCQNNSLGCCDGQQPSCKHGGGWAAELPC